MSERTKNNARQAGASAQPAVICGLLLVAALARRTDRAGEGFGHQMVQHRLIPTPD